MHVVIVGGGLIGMLTARECALAGLEVTLLERQQTGREASWAGGGILSPLYPWRYPTAVSALAQYSQARYQSLCDALNRESGIDPQWTRSGLLVLDEHQQVAQAWLEHYPTKMQVADANGLTRLEPALSVNDSSEGLYFPEIAQVRNPRLVQALRGSLVHHGVHLREGVQVSGLLQQQGKVGGVQTEQEMIEADRVIVASGAWTPQLLQGLDVAIEPVRGQMIMFRGPVGLISHILLKDGHYLIPRLDGRVLMGSTLERVGFDKETTQAAHAQLYRLALELVPALTHCTVEKHWAGLRPGSPDGVPYIMEHPQLTGLYINAGHYRNGVVLGPASARLCVDLLLEREPILDPKPYAHRLAA